MLFPSACLWDYGSSYLLPSIRGCFCGLLRNKIHSEISFVFFGPQHGFGNGYISSFGLTIIGAGWGEAFSLFCLSLVNCCLLGLYLTLYLKAFSFSDKPHSIVYPTPQPNPPSHPTQAYTVHSGFRNAHFHG